jgi:site-specific DNA-methyltransferase (adenine-specific)
MGWHSCLRNEWEAICIVQKPLIDNYLKTLERSGVGLLRTQLEEDGAFQSNILEGFKRNDDDSASASEHCTVKPQALIRFLIEMTVPPQRGHVIVDPFAGTGTTCVAAKELGHDYVGIEISPKYADHARKRLDGCLAANPDGQRQKARVDSEGSEAKSKQGELFY